MRVLCCVVLCCVLCCVLCVYMRVCVCVRVGLLLKDLCVRILLALVCIPFFLRMNIQTQPFHQPTSCSPPAAWRACTSQSETKQ